jgi:hypothetical protein
VMTELVLRSADEARLSEAAQRVREIVAEAHRKAGLPAPAEAYGLDAGRPAQRRRT